MDSVPEKRSLSKEEVPKSVSRVLNAAKIQQDWRAKQNRSSEDTGFEDGPARKKQKKSSKVKDGKNTSDLQIKPGESLAHFNRYVSSHYAPSRIPIEYFRRVETSMRESVRAAMQTSSAVTRKAKKEEATSKGKQPETNPNKKKAKAKAKGDSQDDSEEEARSPPPRPKDFTTLSTSAPRRLNDIVQAPPEIKKLPRGAKVKNQTTSSQSLKDGVLSMAQKAMLEEERERAIRLYREMKQRNLGN